VSHGREQGKGTDTMQSKARLQYLRTKVESATPIGRIIILCEACIAFLDQAKKALHGGDKVLFVEKNIRAQNIIREFRNSLNLDYDEKTAAGFYRLYNYMLKQLMQAVRQRVSNPVDTVQGMVQTLLTSWRKAEAQGLGKDVKLAEERKGIQEGSNIRTFKPHVKAYTSLNEGLNIIS